ncbi:hypothetical protein EV359DRAFT_64291 [Lentinula novae-zelandiae]|nr:hypothetical protein EV359DRAFT_64291 [Lentinula novae-zelandiae]
MSQLDPSLLSMDTLSKALNTLDILSSSSSLSGSDTSAPGSGSSGSGGGGEDLGSDDIGDEGRSSTGLGGGHIGYSGSGAGAASGVPCGFWDDDDAIGSCLGAGGAFRPSCSWLGWAVIGFVRRVRAEPITSKHSERERKYNMMYPTGSPIVIVHDGEIDNTVMSPSSDYSFLKNKLFEESKQAYNSH